MKKRLVIFLSALLIPAFSAHAQLDAILQQLHRRQRLAVYRNCAVLIHHRVAGHPGLLVQSPDHRLAVGPADADAAGIADDDLARHAGFAGIWRVLDETA